MPVLPLVESIKVRPLRSGSASWTICNPARSLTDPPGLHHSSLAWISTPGGSRIFRRTSGVLPTACVSESRITSREPAGARRWRRALLPPGHLGERFRGRSGRRAPARDRARAARRARRARRPGGGRFRWRRDSGRTTARRSPSRARGRRRRAPSPDRIRRAGGGARSAPAGPPSAALSFAASDRRHDGEPVAFLERGAQALGVADVLVVFEEVDVAAQAALVVEQFVLDSRV